MAGSLFSEISIIFIGKERVCEFSKILPLEFFFFFFNPTTKKKKKKKRKKKKEKRKKRRNIIQKAKKFGKRLALGVSKLRWRTL